MEALVNPLEWSTADLVAVVGLALWLWAQRDKVFSPEELQILARIGVGAKWISYTVLWGVLYGLATAGAFYWFLTTHAYPFEAIDHDTLTSAFGLLGLYLAPFLLALEEIGDNWKLGRRWSAAMLCVCIPASLVVSLTVFACAGFIGVMDWTQYGEVSELLPATKPSS